MHGRCHPRQPPIARRSTHVPWLRRRRRDVARLARGDQGDEREVEALSGVLPRGRPHAKADVRAEVRSVLRVDVPSNTRDRFARRGEQLSQRRVGSTVAVLGKRPAVDGRRAQRGHWRGRHGLSRCLRWAARNGDRGSSGGGGRGACAECERDTHRTQETRLHGSTKLPRRGLEEMTKGSSAGADRGNEQRC